MSKTLGILNYDYTINITRTAKTNYEQQQEQHRESLYMKLQKALGWILMVGSIVGIWYGISPLIFTLIIGVGLVLTEDQVITI